MFAVMRIEKRLMDMANTNNSGLTTAHNEISTKRRVSNENLIAFVGSNQRTLSKLPPEITADFISDRYLRLQIDAIHGYVNDLLLSNFYPIEPVPSDFYPSPYQPGSSTQTSDKNALQQQVISKTLAIQACFRSGPSILSVQAGTFYIINLSFDLYSLEMFDEAISTGLQGVALFRTFAKTDLSVYSPYFVHALQLLAKFYIEINDIDQAKMTIEEAISTSRLLQMFYTTWEVKFQLGEALRTLAFLSSMKGNASASLEAAQEGVRVYEEAVIEDCIPDRQRDTPYDASTTNETWALALRRFSDKAIYYYCRALGQMSLSLQAMERLEEAFNTDMKALDIFLYSGRFSTAIVEEDIAKMLYRLSHQQYHTFIKLDQTLVYSQQSVDIYRNLWTEDKQMNGLSLCRSLSEQANILGKLRRYDEALPAWKEISEITRDILKDEIFCADALDALAWNYDRLELYDEAATARTESVTVYETVLDSMSEKPAHAYYDLGVDLQLAGRLSEALEAFQTALTMYRTLAFNNPDQYTINVAMTLNKLTLIHIYSNEHDEAFSDGGESMKLHAAMIDKDPTILSEYMYCLQLNLLLADVAWNEHKCLERALDNVVCARELTQRFPEEFSLLYIEAILIQAKVFFRFSRLSQASITIQKALTEFKHSDFQDLQEAQLYMRCILLYCATLDNQGYAQMPLKMLEKSIEVGKYHSSDQVIVGLLVTAMHRRSETILWMGSCAEATSAIAVCEALARQNASTNVLEFIECLLACALIFRDMGELGKATKFVEEAIELCRTDKLKQVLKTLPAAYILESQSICILSECLADMGRESEAIVYAKNSLDKARGLKNDPTSPWPEIQKSYIEILHILSMRLAANGDLPQALEMIVEVRSYYENCVKHISGESVSLARALLAETTLYCAVGRHDEGSAARSKLQELKTRLSASLPELADRVHTRLAREQTYPATILLLAKLDLRCGHHKEAFEVS